MISSSGGMDRMVSVKRMISLVDPAAVEPGEQARAATPMTR